MALLLDSEDIVDLAQTHIEALCAGGFSGCVFHTNIVSGMSLAGKMSASVKQYMTARGSIAERHDVFKRLRDI